jgi:hypothetical protein
MAFFTKQWLRPEREFGFGRRREHEPIEAKVEVEHFKYLRDSWSRENKIRAGIRFIRGDGKYNVALLTTRDLRSLLPALLDQLPPRTLEYVAEVCLELIGPDVTRRLIDRVGTETDS